MKSLFKVLLLSVFLSTALLAQTIKISGVVLDAETGLPLEGVNVVISESQPILVTDRFGNFDFSSNQLNTNQIVFSRIGYKTYRFNVDQLTNLSLEIRLNPANLTLGEVTVTSTRYSKLERDVALPLEVVSGEKLEKKISITIPDILNNEPGITVVRDGIWATDINIRGLSRQNVVTLVDGNRIETASNLAAGLSLIDMFDIQRIEVIKGGVSSLYGTGATGGVINVTTKSPTYSDDLHLSGTLTSGYNSVNEGGMGNISLIASSDKAFIKVSGSIRYANNTQTPAGELPNSQFDDNYFSGLVGVVPIENQELRISFQNFTGKDIGIPGGKSFPQTAIARYLLAERKMYSAEYRFKNLIPSLANTSVKYFYQGIERSVELKPNAPTRTLPRATHSTNGVQFQTNWLLDNYNQVVAGIDFWQRKYSGFREMIVKTDLTTKITADYPVPNSKYLSTGFFAQNESRILNNKLAVTLGGRFDLIRVTNDETRNPAYISNNGVTTFPPNNPLASFAEGKHNDQSWSGNIGLLFSLTNDVDLTFNFAHAFRSPVLEERFQYINLGGDVYLGNPDLKSERGYFIDAGFRIWDDDLSLKSNFYYNAFNNLVVDKPIIIDSLYRKENVGKARLYGFDLGLEYNLMNKIILFTTASFVQGEDTETDSNLPQIPPFNGRLGIKSSTFKYVSFEFAAAFFAAQNKVAFGETKTPGYVLFDIYLSSMLFDFGFMNFRFYTGVENILDKDYRNHLSTNRGQILSEPGRNFFVRTNFAF